MEAYRDQYATLFNNGRNVVVIGISVDADTTLASWAREKDFPMLFGSDRGSKVGILYSAHDSARKQDDRSLYVIGPDGRITFAAKPFRALVQKSYTDLAEAIDKLAPPVKDSAQ
ncbi:MAG: redoxin domain-containing protein [Gemmatimonadaceae bacterium]|nr:redoxin domain-containing protein [Gemmatimonadaceae bacterium]